MLQKGWCEAPSLLSLLYRKRHKGPRRGRSKTPFSLWSSKFLSCLKAPRSPLRTVEGIQRGWCKTPFSFSLQNSIGYKGPESRVQSTISSVVSQVLIIAHSSRELHEIYGRDYGTILPDRAGDGANHHLQYRLLRSLISDRGWSRISSFVIYHGVKHHGVHLSQVLKRQKTRS